jgi:hypothetical protein
VPEQEPLKHIQQPGIAVGNEQTRFHQTLPSCSDLCAGAVAS